MITTRDKILSAVMKPTRYTGGELNSVIKNPADVDVRFGFCFADTYEIAMSHLGLKILYHTLNDREDTYCERVFAPWTDMEEEMKKHGMKLFALETGDEITHFDMLGFTLQYELSYSNIVNMLMLADIPVRAKDRDESYPIVCGGGPCAYNAEPVADIFDFFMLGEGEDSIHEVVEEYVKWKKSGKKNKRDYLEAIAEIEGIYVPSFYDVEYNDDNMVKSVTPNNPHAKPKVRKRIMKDFNATYAPETIIVPFGEVVHDRVMLEVMRGCLRGCRLGLTYPEINEMQVRAIFSAACDLKKEGLNVKPEVMIPLIGHVNELKTVQSLLERVAKEVMNEKGVKVDYMFGTMIEIPRAALTADKIAEYAEFFSFGTNDLTQMTFGYSRDDAEGKFLQNYVEQKILPANPFATLDQEGVGQLMKIALEKALKVRPHLKRGICGEHGGDPASVKFCHRIGLNYVSCSPFRVPQARLAAAQAVIEFKHSKEEEGPLGCK